VRLLSQHVVPSGPAVATSAAVNEHPAAANSSVFTEYVDNDRARLARGTKINGEDRIRFASAAAACALDFHAGMFSCPPSPPEDHSACLAVCLEANKHASNALYEPTAEDRAEFAAVAAACAREAESPLSTSRYCASTPERGARICARICVEAALAAWSAPPRSRLQPPPVNLPPLSPVTVPPSSTASTALPAPPKTEDPYERAPRLCIAGIREHGGPPVCRFDRPLDDMDFGQRHCNERCALKTAVARDAGP
jgi:hypothetical protein